MKDALRPALNHAARTASSFASQVVAAIVTGVCVALITNAILARTDKPADVGAAASTTEAAAFAASPLPALQPVVIRDVPAPLSRAPAASAPELLLGSGGLYYAATEATTDPLPLSTRPDAQPPA